jgi:shikimate kinase
MNFADKTLLNSSDSDSSTIQTILQHLKSKKRNPKFNLKLKSKIQEFTNKRREKYSLLKFDDFHEEIQHKKKELNKVRNGNLMK